MCTSTTTGSPVCSEITFRHTRCSNRNAPTTARVAAGDMAADLAASAIAETHGRLAVWANDRAAGREVFDRFRGFRSTFATRADLADLPLLRSHLDCIATAHEQPAAFGSEIKLFSDDPDHRPTRIHLPEGFSYQQMPPVGS